MDDKIHWYRSSSIERLLDIFQYKELSEPTETIQQKQQNHGFFILFDHFGF
jgi:hypothetical protein